MYDLKITKEAYKDIDDIVSYISGVLKNPIAASNFLKEFEKNCETIAFNPESYAYCNDARLKETGYRKFSIKNYIVFYRVGKSENVVYIMRVVYGRRDYTNLI